MGGEGVMFSNIKVIEYDVIGSTNTEAKIYAQRTDARESVLFIASEQTAGRGRLGRSFLSRSGRGIYMSLLYFTGDALTDAISITSAAAVIVARAIENAVGSPMKIKWVNDIYNSRGKVAGILVESLPLGDTTAIVVGVGINVGDDDFPEALCGIASSIGYVNDDQRKKIVSDIVSGILGRADMGADMSFIGEYRSRSMLDGERVELFSAGESIGCGRVEGISDDGGLVVLFDGEQCPRVIRTGEVSVRKKQIDAQ